MGITDDFVVKFKENVSKKTIDSLYQKYNLKVYKRSELFDWLIVPYGSNVLEIANTIQESGFTLFSHPNFLCKGEKYQVIPNDTYFANQFYLRNTGQVFCDGHYGTPGADNKASYAWSTTIGMSNIVVAVLDEGVVSDHPDIPNTRQVRLDSSNFADGARNDPSPTGNCDHGTACAGIIGATQNNNQGISGVAPNVKIMPIRIFDSYEQLISTAGIALAFNYARRHGADVISNSWGYYGSGDTDPNLFPDIVSAVQIATTQGRGGKGCVVTFAASNSADLVHNQNGEVRFPANMNVSGVLTVGASDRNDSQANYSPTGNPSSPNNQVIDVVAPSHKAYSSQITGETYEIYSCDIPNDPGYNSVKSTDGNGGNLPVVGSILPNSGTNYLAYTARMGGTSAASPQVAAEAALILSINPNLTQQQVFNIITSTADKVGGYTYTNGKCDQLGYGRININTAVSQALSGTGITISGSTIVCSSGTTFTVNNVPPGYSVYWDKSSNITLPTDRTTNPIVATTNGSGTGWVQATINSTTYGSVTLPQYPVVVGSPTPTITAIKVSGSGEPTHYDFTATFYAGATYNWYVNNVFNLNGPNTFDWYFQCNKTSTIKCNLLNSCGTSSFSNSISKTGECRTLNVLALSPNPASNTVQVNIISEVTDSTTNLMSTSVLITQTTYTVSIFNSLGTQFLSTQVTGTPFSLPVGNLRDGTYIVTVSDGKNKYSKPLVVKH
jgi:subtilisin family serine protease